MDLMQSNKIFMFWNPVLSQGFLVLEKKLVKIIQCISIFSSKNQNTKYEDILFICPCMCASSISFIVLSVFRSRYLKRWFCKFWIYFSNHSWPELLMKLLSALSKTIHQKIALNAYSKIFTSKCCILTFPTKIPLWKTMHCNAWFTESQREPQRLCMGIPDICHFFSTVTNFG